MGSPDSNGTLATKIRTNEAYSGHIKVTYVTETVVKGIPDKYVGDCRINVGVINSADTGALGCFVLHLSGMAVGEIDTNSPEYLQGIKAVNGTITFKATIEA